MRTVDLASFEEMLRTAEADELVKATEEAVQVDLLYRISNETFAIEVKEEEPEPVSEQSGSEDRTPIQKIPEPSSDSEFRGVCAHPKLGAVARIVSLCLTLVALASFRGACSRAGDGARRGARRRGGGAGWKLHA